jgi:hypothetical protein
MKIRLMLGQARARLATAIARGRERGNELGASTAEYAMVLVAAAGFATLLGGILKSAEMRTLLLGIVRKALSAG